MRAGSREKEGLGARIHRRPQESIWPCGSGDHEGGMWRRKEEDGKVGAASSQSGDALSQQRRSHFMRAVCILQLLVLTRGHYHILLQLPPPPPAFSCLLACEVRVGTGCVHLGQ